MIHFIISLTAALKGMLYFTLHLCFKIRDFEHQEKGSLAMVEVAGECGEPHETAPDNLLRFPPSLGGAALLEKGQMGHWQLGPPGAI